MSGYDQTRLGRSGQVFQRAVEEDRSVLVGYLPVGFPDVAASIAAMRAATEGVDGTGCDLLEIGLPYSDPVMDGVAIQHAGTAALDRGVRTRDLFSAVEQVAATGTLPLTMTYWNLVERYGVDRFARDLAAAGGAGLITPDLTPDEAEEWIAASDRYQLDRVFLVAPSSTDERVQATVAQCRGFVYATAVMGVTGTRDQVSDAAPRLVSRVRKLGPGVPVGVGLGVSNGEQAATLARHADGVIVGSALVKTLIAADQQQTPTDTRALRELVADLARGVRAR
ncbi:MAG: tryptophan synthase subunit alpha [Actinomycetia bacterium]|nr:tryptophan synthase subunit alpha [Actinomycetes bacterium]